MTKRKIGIALAVVVAGAGAVWIAANWGIEQTDDAQLQSHIYQVSSRIPGLVDKVLVDAHDQVLPNQPLVPGLIQSLSMGSAEASAWPSPAAP